MLYVCSGTTVGNAGRLSDSEKYGNVLERGCLGRSIALTFRIRSIPNELETSKNSAQLKQP